MESTISQINSAGTGVTGAGTASNAQTTKTQFLQLLLAQLKNQDPLSPADTDQMTQQMMSLGQLEQLFDLNQNIKGLSSIASSSQLATYSSMVGKNALAKGNSFEIKGEEKGSINFGIAHVPNSTMIRVFDGAGNLVAQLEPEITDTGMQSIAFNGLGMGNKQLKDGFYTFTVEALNNDGGVVPVDTFTVGRINSIRLNNGVPVFEMGRNDVGLSDIERIF